MIITMCFYCIGLDNEQYNMVTSIQNSIRNKSQAFLDEQRESTAHKIRWSSCNNII